MAQKLSGGKLYPFVLLLSLTITFLFIISCEDSPNEPEEVYGSRDYEWVVDTIDPGESYFTYGFNLWGAEPNDVWFIGGATTRKDPIWHWDGTKWKNVVLDEFITGAGIWGTSKNNVWMGTTNSSIWHYDGAQWQKFGTYLLDGYDQTVIQKIHGISETQIYGVGYANRYDGGGFTRVLMKYDGIDWRFINIGELKESFVDVVVDGKSGDVLIDVSNRFTPGEPRRIYVYKADSLKEIFAGDVPISLGVINTSTYVVIDQEIYKYSDESLKLFKDFKGTEYGGRIWGRNESDFFVVNTGLNLGHFNGKDLKTLYSLNAVIGQAVIFKKEVFVFGTGFSNYPQDYILRGKLKTK